jgi:hypothetical protein
VWKLSAFGALSPASTSSATPRLWLNASNQERDAARTRLAGDAVQTVTNRDELTVWMTHHSRFSSLVSVSTPVVASETFVHVDAHTYKVLQCRVVEQDTLLAGYQKENEKLLEQVKVGPESQ